MKFLNSLPQDAAEVKDMKKWMLHALKQLSLCHTLVFVLFDLSSNFLFSI